MTTKKGYRTCKKCTKNRALRFFTPKGYTCATCRKATTRKQSKRTHLQQVYGITLEEYETLMERQTRKCAICFGTRTGYDVDHDHKLERQLIAEGHENLEARRMSVRGLLCRRCNRRLLPSCLDTPAILEQAIEYLNHPPAEEVLNVVQG